MMPAYNAGAYVGLAIESVLAQTYPHWELIVVNDGSTDETAAVLARYSDPRIKQLRQENSGEAAARNTALGQMQGEIVAFLDADDLFLPHHLQVTRDALHAHAECDGVYTDGFTCDQRGRRLQTLSSRRRGPFEGWIFEEMVRASDVFGAPVCVVLRRNIILQHQIEFDPQIVIGPDWDFLIRYSEFARFGYAPQQTCLYRIHPTSISFRAHSRERAFSLARCREKAMGLHSFNACSVETRTQAFYDLLVNHLKDCPDWQAKVTQRAEFQELPREIQARLFRLMASQALQQGSRQAPIADWLDVSRRLNPKDRRGAWLRKLYGLSPPACQWLLRIKTAAQTRLL